ncbi:hypothetical protein HG530_005559 [Fusarium avenaceum]|nr:hypothetical protein HG530_005559 [Fusarium avenaceum]
MEQLTGHRTKSFQTLQVTDNDMSLDHSLGTSSHCDSKHNDQGCRDHRKTSRHSIDDNLFLAPEVVGGHHDNGTHNSCSKKDKSQLGKLALKGSSDIDTKESTDSIGACQSPRLHPATSIGVTLSVTFGLSTFGRLAPESHSNLANFVEELEGFASKKCFVRFEVDGFHETKIGRNGITSLELDHVTRDNLGRYYNLIVAVADSMSSWGAERTKRIHGLGGLKLLKETNDDVKHNDSGDYTALNPRLNAK